MFTICSFFPPVQNASPPPRKFGGQTNWRDPVGAAPAIPMRGGMVPVVYATELRPGSAGDVGSMEVVTAVPVKFQLAAGGTAHQQGSCCDGCRGHYESSQLFQVGRSCQAGEGGCQDKKLCMACFVWLSTKGTLDRVGDELAAPGGGCSTTLHKAGEGRGGSSSGCVHAGGEGGKRQALLVDTAPEIVVAEGGRNPSATHALREASEAYPNAVHGTKMMAKLLPTTGAAHEHAFRSVEGMDAVNNDGSDDALDEDVEIEELLLDDVEEEQTCCIGDRADGDAPRMALDMSTAAVDTPCPRIQPCAGPRTPATVKKAARNKIFGKGTRKRTQNLRAMQTAAAAANKKVRLATSRCTYEGCPDPEKSRKFLKIGDHTTAAGQDWSPLCGQVLCHACYGHYFRHGTLQREAKVREPRYSRCTYEGCRNPEESSWFCKIGDHTRAGWWKDWRPLVGQVLCQSCYTYYRKYGTLVRKAKVQEPRYSRCTYEGCLNPEESRRFYKIGYHTRAGWADWSSLYGQVLCHACYSHYSSYGTLEHRPLMGRTAQVGANIGQPMNPGSDGEECYDDASCMAEDMSTAAVDTQNPRSTFKASSRMMLDLEMIRAYKAEWRLPSLDEEIQGLRRGIYKRALAERRARELAAHCGESEH